MNYLNEELSTTRATQNDSDKKPVPRMNAFVRLLCPCVVVALLTALFAPKAGHADDPNDILVVINKKVKHPKMSPAEIKNIFLKLTTRWKDGNKIVPINAKQGTPLRQEFLKAVINMTEAREKDYWHDRKIRVGASKPPEFSHTQKAVFKLKGAIGYVYRSEHKDGVTNVILVIPALKKAIQ